MTHSLRAIAPALVLVAAATSLAGCGSSTTSDTASKTGSKTGSQTLAITVKGDDVEPENKRVEVDKSEPLTLKITADRSGELHVHSSPEQHVEFKAGTTTKQLRFTVPGVIELEEHQSDSLIAQLEVR